MKHFNRNIGSYGEDLACNFLIKKHHKILAKNYNIKLGEIDIVSKIDNILVFTEVKSRYTKDFGSPCQAVTLSKINTIRRVAMHFIYKNNIYNTNIRFDVIEGILNHYNNDYYINHFENAFWHSS